MNTLTNNPEDRVPINEAGFKKPLRQKKGNGYPFGESELRLVPVSSLYPTQEIVISSIVSKHMNSLETRPPEVVDTNGKLLVADGHHRIAAAIAKGDKNILVSVFPKWGAKGSTEGWGEVRTWKINKANANANDSPLLQHHKTKVALDALLEMYADPTRATETGDWHADPDYDDPLAMKGTEPENVKYGDAPLPAQKTDGVDPTLNPEDKIFKRSKPAADLSMVISAAGGRSFMYKHFKDAHTAHAHLVETARYYHVADFGQIWAWAEKNFPVKEAVVEQKLTPKMLPQRDDMRGHLDEDVKDEINEIVDAPVMQGAKGVHIGASQAEILKAFDHLLNLLYGTSPNELSEEQRKDLFVYVRKYLKESLGRLGINCIASKTSAKKSLPEKKYPDTAGGAIACLQSDSTLDVKEATARPDPSVEGVWEVRCPNGDRAIVYLAGYKDPFGQIRSRNDFEAETQEDRDFAMEDLNDRANEEIEKTSDLGDQMRNEDARAEYTMDQVRDARKEAYQAFLQDPFYQQEAQDNGTTLEELWAQVGEDFTNEYWQAHRASYKKVDKTAACPICKSSNVIPVEDLAVKTASGCVLQECRACGSFFTF